jgi:UDP-galactopyranose mutase
VSFDYLIVGAGFAGAVMAERLASQLNKRVLLVERRGHIGGNCFDYYDDQGILVQKYGPHIFHTRYPEVWHYLSQFTEWYLYQHRVLAYVNNKKIPVPFNLNSLYEIFSPDYARKVEQTLINQYGWDSRIAITTLLQSDNEIIKSLSQLIFEKIFLHYSLKQWGVNPLELTPDILARVPVAINRDDRYFLDPYQGIPRPSYHRLFARLLSHPNIHILLQTDYQSVLDLLSFSQIIYTGPIDYFFDYQFGKLPYRSMLWKFQTRSQEQVQEVAVVNYPCDYDFTRITEYKHFTGQQHPASSISFEYPCDYDPARNDPAYPILTLNNRELYEKYEQAAEGLKNVHFLGRLAQYRYYNMDEIVKAALDLFQVIANAES